MPLDERTKQAIQSLLGLHNRIRNIRDNTSELVDRDPTMTETAANRFDEFTDLLAKEIYCLSGMHPESRRPVDFNEAVSSVKQTIAAFRADQEQIFFAAIIGKNGTSEVVTYLDQMTTIADCLAAM